MVIRGGCVCMLRLFWIDRVWSDEAILASRDEGVNGGGCRCYDVSLRFRTPEASLARWTISTHDSSRQASPPSGPAASRCGESHLPDSSPACFSEGPLASRRSSRRGG